MSELALQLIKENKITQDPFLDLGMCGLKNYLPEELLDCVWLEKLNLGAGYSETVESIELESKNNQAENIFDGGELIILEKLEKLKDLSLNNIHISNISFLQNCSHLHALDLSSTDLEDYSFLENLTQLQSLNLKENLIQDISFLKNLSQLQALDLTYNEIQEADALKKMNRLQYLSLAINSIEDAHFLENLTALQTLNLWGNKIQETSALQRLSQLRFLDMSSNQIKIFNLNLLTSFPDLHTLFLYENPITNIPSEIFDKEDVNVLAGVKEYFFSLQKSS